MAHSKRNTSRAVFTAHERDELRGTWGSQQTRLTRDSFLPFGSCTLCLMPAQDPVACAGYTVPASEQTNGERRPRCHLFCRECAVVNLLEQKKKQARLAKARDAETHEAAQRDAVDDEEAQRRAVDDFERVQMGLAAKLGSSTDRTIVAREAGRVVVEEHDNAPGQAGKKRKIELDEDELLRAAADDRANARRKLDEERAAASKTKLPSFWVPGRLPDKQAPRSTVADAMADVKSTPVCPGSGASTSHTLSLATLVPVKFSTEGQAASGVCPACNRPLTNASKAVLAAPCGHVLCRACVEKFVEADDQFYDKAADQSKRTLRCYVCSEPVSGAAKTAKDKDGNKKKSKIKPGLLDINSDGTGFAGGGKNMVKRDGVSFQC